MHQSLRLEVALFDLKALTGFINSVFIMAKCPKVESFELSF